MNASAQPLVSIIFPVYQVSDYVERSLCSLLKQTYEEIECIIVDDASTDESIEKCERLISGYFGPIRFKFLHHKKNRGLSAARNTGTDAASGDYLYYMDSDDEISPQCIESLVSIAVKDNSFEMVQGSYIRVYDSKVESHKTKDIRIKNNEEARTQYLKYRNLNYTVWNKLLKKSFVVDNLLYNKEGIINEDLLWTFYLIKTLSKAYLCSEVTYYYHVRPDSIVNSTKSEVRGTHFVAIYDEILHNLTPRKEKSEIKGYLMNFARLYATYSRCVPDFKKALHLYKSKAKQFDCWNDYMALCFLGGICKYFNPDCIMGKLYKLRRKFVR